MTAILRAFSPKFCRDEDLFLNVKLWCCNSYCDRQTFLWQSTVFLTDADLQTLWITWPRFHRPRWHFSVILLTLKKKCCQRCIQHWVTTSEFILTDAMLNLNSCLPIAPIRRQWLKMTVAWSNCTGGKCTPAGQCCIRRPHTPPCVVRAALY